MAESTSGRTSTWHLILVPAIITLAITLLRLVGELQHWAKPWFSNSPGGGGAVIGISWLPFIFGPYFALKLAGMGSGPAKVGKAAGLAIAGFILMLGGGIVGLGPKQFAGKIVVVLIAVLVGLVLQIIAWVAWPALLKTLLAYGYAARIPVVIVMFFALRGNWGTHYDGLPPNYNGPTALLPKFALVGLLPQLVGWPLYTVVIGTALGGLAAAVVRRGKAPAQSA